MRFKLLEVETMRPGDSILEKLIFSSKEHGKIHFFETEESESRRGILSVKASGRFGTLQFREVVDEAYSFRFGSFEIAEDMTLTSILDIPYMGLLINLGNNFGYLQEGIKPGVLKRNECSIVSLPYLHTKSKLYRGLSYSIFDIFFSPKYLQNWEKAFASVARVLSKVHRNIPLFENFEAPNGPRGIAAMVTDIKNIVENTEHKRLYRRNKINEFLFSLFDLYESSGSGVVLHPDEIKKLHEVHDILIGNLEISHSLKELAHNIGMNEFKLKNGFKKLFGSPVFKFFLEERMKKAKDLLAEKNKPINEIAVLVGYKNISSFSAAFKKRFGYPPSAVR